MSRTSFCAAVSAIEKLFEEELQTLSDDWRYEGQTFQERIEAHLQCAVEALEDELQSPEEDPMEDQAEDSE